MKKRLERSEIDPAEYILMLEKQNKELEKEAAKVVPLRERIQELDTTIDSLHAEIAELKKTVTDLENEREEIIRRYEERIADIVAENERKTAELIAKYCRKNFRIAISGELETDNERVFANENLPVFDVKVLSFEFVETRLDIIYGSESEFEESHQDTQNDWFIISNSMKKAEA